MALIDASVMRAASLPIVENVIGMSTA